MKLEQTSIFDFVEEDEIKERLKELRLGEETELLQFKIRLTDYGYEIENDDIHIGFLTFTECYIKINRNLKVG